MIRLAFIGLGVMGYPMAGHLKRRGYDVTVFNRTHSRAQKWVSEFNGKLAETPANAAEDCDIIFSCVGRDDDLREVALSKNGIFNALKPGSVFVDHTTVSASISRELSTRAMQHGAYFIDAPVSGGEQGAKTGQLTIMCGGDPDAYARIEPVIKSYAKQSRLMGPSGSGQLTKMVNQICIAGLVEGLSEGLSFARAVGLNPASVVDVISKGAAQSWQMENRYQTMLAGFYEHGFAVEWMRKDLALCFEEAARNDVQLPVTKLVDEFYSEVEAMGGQRWDTSSLLKRLEMLRGRA